MAAVNGRAIGADAFAAQLDAVAAQLKRAPDASERAAILERVIDEELLLQQGLALELPRKDARLRAQLVQEVIRQALAESARSPVTEAELRAFHAAQSGFFRQPATYRVWRFDCRDAAAARAQQARLRRRRRAGAAGRLPAQRAAARCLAGRREARRSTSARSSRPPWSRSPRCEPC